MEAIKKQQIFGIREQMTFQYNFFKQNLNLYYCDVCGAEIFGSGKVELFYWLGKYKKRNYIKVRRCGDCKRTDFEDEIG